MKPRTGSLEVLASLKSKEYKIGLISDCTAETPLAWQNTPFAPFFDATVFSCRAGIKKPDPRIYEMATTRLGVGPQYCLYIGDGSSRELSGASTFLKLVLLGGAYHGFLPVTESVLLVFVLAALASHAPKLVRHRLLF